jgi:hypothetical protein
MLVEASCPNGHRLQVPLEHAGMKLRCPACNVIFTLTNRPDGGTVAATPPPGTAPAPSPGNPTAAGAATATNGAAAAAGNAPTAPLEPATSRWSGSEPGAATSTTPAPAPSPGGTATNTPAPPAAAQTSGSTAGGSTTTPAGRIAPPATRLPRPAVPISVRPLIHTVLGIGLLLVLTARGCDRLSARNAARIQSQVDLSQRLFDEEREQAFVDAQTALEQPNLTPAKKTELQKQLDTVHDTYDRRRRELQQGEWRLLTNASQRSSAENKAAAYWHELTFVCGTLLFAIGLLALALHGQGPERWLAFGLLAIVVFSIYIGGAPWAATLGGAGS